MGITNVLIVEDELIIAKGIEKRLKGLGFGVPGLASSGEEGIQKAFELRPDLVLMDINLGSGIDGIEAAERIRSKIDIPVVFLTAHSDEATLKRAKLTGPHGYILKPFEDKDLQIAIEIGHYRHQVERRLRENEQWLATALGSIGDGVIATNELGQIRFMNERAEKLTGWKLSEALDRDCREIFVILNVTTREPVKSPVSQVLQSEQPTDLEPNTILIRKDGSEIPIDDSTAPMRDIHGKLSGSVLVFKDITERMRLEEHLRQAIKMEAIGRLAGGIAHDFNNILTIITGFSELLLTGDQEDQEREKSILHINDAGKRAAELTQQLMAFSRKQTLIPCLLNLNTIVRDIGFMVKRLIGSNIEFLTEIDPDLGQVKADPSQIGQIVLNLAANARDAMPQGGKLILATANRELQASILRNHPDVLPGHYAMLSVTDTGLGIPIDLLDRIFDPFFTTKGVGQGTGLGLASVHGIVKQSGGHIEVSSQVGVGTTFRIYLPLVFEEPATIQGDTPAIAKGSETILLVEDEENVRCMIKRVLNLNGYTVLEAANGLDAVQLAENHPTQIHMVMTDVMMPKLSGREVVERLQKRLPKIKVMFMSGYTEDVILKQGVESAKVNFLQKPFVLAAMVRKIRNILDQP